MSWLEELRLELTRRGIRGRWARRIELELADHLACDPEARVGAPADVAERFVTELRVVRTRRATLSTFGALALAGLLLVVATGSIGLFIGRWPIVTGARATAVAFSGLAMVACGQIALVAGTLALVPGLRSRDSRDLGLAQRRSFVAIGAGAVTSSALLVHAAVLRPMPTWWVALAVVCGAVPLPVLAAAVGRVRGAALLTPAGGSAPALEADLPTPLRRHPAAVLTALGFLAVAVVAGGTAVAENSLVEGLIRGALEGLGLLAAVVLLGRLLGLRR